MTAKKLGEVLESVSDTIRNDNNIWEFYVSEVIMICITDEASNRMRIIAPIADMKDVSVDMVNDAMEANFHSALDVRYCISDNLMWAAFMHPYQELDEDMVLEALSQLYNAVRTFGTTYSSTSLAFPRSPAADTIPGKKY